MKTLTMSLVALLSMGALAGKAEASDRYERASNRQELRTDRHERRDDKRDLAMMDSLIRSFDHARSRNDRYALNRIDADLRYIVDAELAESRAELARDHAEVRRDTWEVRDERRDVARNEYYGAPSSVRYDDREDLRDDRRDRRDDVRDLRKERAELEQKTRIANELFRLYGRFGYQKLERKRALMVELAQLGAREIHENRKELREDRREAREDRAERRY